MKKRLMLFSMLVPLCVYADNDIEILRNYMRECENNNAVSCNLAGYKLDEGDGVCTDKFEALVYYKKACQLGYKVSCENYQNLIDEGYGEE